MNWLLSLRWLGEGTVPDPRAQNLYLFLMLGTMGFMFYFLIFRPQQKKSKDHEALVKALKAGDKVVTGSGIVGVIVTVKDRTVSLRSGDTKLEMLKSAISEVTERNPGSAPS